MYYGKSVSRKVIVGDQEVIVDSYLEERVLRHLEANGFHDKWAKPAIGLNVGKSNYTPDIELSVQLDGLVHRALVEIKPAKSFLTPYIWKRMLGVATHYNTKLLLLYAEKENSWYRIDFKTGEVTFFEPPVPGNIVIAKMWKPIAMSASSVYDHKYKKAAVPTIANMLLNLIAEIISAPFVTPKKRKRSNRRKR